MSKNHLTLILLLSLFLASCKEEAPKFTLEAELTNVPDGYLFYLESLSKGIKMDSAYLKDGKLSLSTQLEHPEKLMLFTTGPEGNDFIYTFLIVGNEATQFKADRKDMPWNVDVSGSIHHEIAEKLNQLEYQRQILINELRKIYGSKKGLLKEKVTQVQDSLDEAKVSLIKQNFNSYAAIDNFKIYKTKFTPNELSSLYSQLDENLKQTKAGKAIKLQSENPMPEVGDDYYDYKAINQEGKSMALSDIQDKHILLHFSSSACYGSQLSLNDLRKVYADHGDELEIVSISEDANKESWMKHVKRDSISWTYLWDGEGEFNDAVVKYWEIGTPNFVLISPEKKILERWYGYRKGMIGEKINAHIE